MGTRVLHRHKCCDIIWKAFFIMTTPLLPLVGNVQFDYGDNFGNGFCTSTSATMYAKVIVQKLGYKDISSKAFFTMTSLLENIISLYQTYNLTFVLVSFLTCIVKQRASEFLNALVLEKNLLKIVPMAKLDSFSLPCSLKYCPHFIYL